MTDPDVEQEIIKLAHEWIEAGRRRDRTALERILADDFIIAGWLPEGRLADKQTYIEDCLRPVDVGQSSYKYDRWDIRIYGDTAIANCTLEIHALVGGSDWGGNFLFTQVWFKRDGRWQVVSCHSSPVLEAQGGASS
jgi:ketosteroid isomerase-like protein